MLFKKEVIIFIVFLGVIVRIAWMCYDRPVYNWDLLAYMAVILEHDHDSPDVVHDKVYKVSKEELSPDAFANLTDSTIAIRKTMAENPEQFAQYLSFFRIKPLYTWLATAAYRVGVPLSKAPFLPSVFSYICIAVLLAYWLQQFYPLWISCVLSFGMMISPPMLESALIATPDGFSTLIILLCLWSLQKEFHWVWFVMLSIVCVLVRVDNIMFVATTTLFLVFTNMHKNNRAIRMSSVLSLLIGLVMVMLIMYSSSYHGAFENFYGGLFRKLNPVVIMKDAIAGLTSLQNSHLSIGLVICFVLLFHKNYSPAAWTVKQYMFLILVVYLVVHFIAFPSLTTRLLLPVYVGAFLLSMNAISELINIRIKKIDPSELT